MPKQPKDNTKPRRHQSKPWTHSDPTQVASAKKGLKFVLSDTRAIKPGGDGRVCLGVDTGKIEEALVLLSRTQLSACQMNAHSETNLISRRQVLKGVSKATKDVSFDV